MAAPKEGGFKMSLGGLKGKVGLKASPAQKPVAKKSRLALLGDDEPDDTNKQQEISGWDAAGGGAVEAGGKKEEEGPRIIPSLPNRNWQEEARKKQLSKAPHTQVQNEAVKEIKEEQPMQFGLTILKKEEAKADDSTEAAASAEPMEDVKDNLTEEQRLEKKALHALVNGEPTDDLVIPVQNEEETFRNGLREAPEAPSLAAYEATPIEGFGAALLRGMGWKDGAAIGKNGVVAKPKEVKRRPALLGIGAKAEAAMGVELGEWSGGKKKGKGKKEAESYNPLTLRNKVTGELITEEELKAKLEQQELLKDDKPSKERRKYSDDEDDERRREKRRDRRDDRDRDRRRDDDFQSGSRRDRDRKDDRRRDKYRDDDYDSERRREKRRDREDDYDSERRSDKRRDRDRRDRSRSPNDDRREKRRDRYRSRSRDSKRDRDRRDKSRDSDDRRKRRKDREYEYDDDREDRKKRYKDDKYSK